MQRSNAKKLWINNDYHYCFIADSGHSDSRWKYAPTRSRMGSVGSELWLQGRLRASWRSTLRWNRSRQWKPLLSWRSLYESKGRLSAFGSATDDTGRNTWNRWPHQIHRPHQFQPWLRILPIPNPRTTCRQFDQQVRVITQITKNETIHTNSRLLFAVESSPMKLSLQPSVQGSTVSSGTSRKRTIIEGPPKNALEKHFGKETKPSLATITSLAASLQGEALEAFHCIDDAAEKNSAVSFANFEERRNIRWNRRDDSNRQR